MQIKTNISLIPLFEGYCRKNDIDGKEIVAIISGHKVTLKVAAKDDTQAKGLMGSDEPEEDTGMIFVYDMPILLHFWMKNVDFPLDIIFFDENMDYINHTTMDPYNGESDDELKRYNSDKPAQYAVELKSGWCDKNLKEGCKLKF